MLGRTTAVYMNAASFLLDVLFLRTVDGYDHINHRLGGYNYDEWTFLNNEQVVHAWMT
jgi:hypothetical protein